MAGHGKLSKKHPVVRRGMPQRRPAFRYPIRIEQMPGRNEPCPCGSGKKYKRCCLFKHQLAARAKTRLIATDTTIFGSTELLRKTHETGEYVITTASQPIAGISPEEMKQLIHFHRLLQDSEVDIDEALLGDIVAFWRQRSDLPQVWNLLCAAYQAGGDDKKATETLLEAYKHFPHYFFARINMALHWLRIGELLRAGELLDGKRSVKEFEPSLQEFHVSAVETFHHVMVLYCIEKNDLIRAQWHRKTLHQLLGAVGWDATEALESADRHIAEAKENATHSHA